MPTEIERLYREHRAGLVRLVEREVRDHHEAEDVVQTAFLDAQRALERGTIPRNPRAWLAAIALNAARRLRRRRLNAAPLEEYAVEEASGVSEIRVALTSLPREQRTAVVYRDVLGLSYGETAEQMGRSVNSVTMLLHRGRRRLRQTLGVTTGGVGLWRWVRKAGLPQAAVVKGGAAVVAAAGLATTGIVAARVVAPVGNAGTAAAAMRFGSPAVGARRTPGAALASLSARRRVKTGRGAAVSEAPVSTQSSGGGAPPAAVRSSTSVSSTTDVEARSPLPLKLRVPTVSLPTLRIPTSPVTVAATVTVSTPIATVTVATPPSTTATVSTPIATVTLPIP
ncbi:MAG TPA: sigma-70 family RNA polymerase sigma factor [Gaiellaceae bacterium]|nr:sigma-70 family RNA polymerase sigma factor [Gaiellaceae bacterium]